MSLVEAVLWRGGTGQRGFKEAAAKRERESAKHKFDAVYQLPLAGGPDAHKKKGKTNA